MTNEKDVSGCEYIYQWAPPDKPVLCGRSAAWRYPAMGGGYMHLCEMHAARHLTNAKAARGLTKCCGCRTAEEWEREHPTTRQEWPISLRALVTTLIAQEFDCPESMAQQLARRIETATLLAGRIP